MKKIVRLTEGDLHRIIKESVNNMIQELNGSTYGNAARKSAERYNDYQRQIKDKDTFLNRLNPKKRREIQNLRDLANKEELRADRFSDAASDNFQREFGYSDDETGFDYKPYISRREGYDDSGAKTLTIEPWSSVRKNGKYNTYNLGTDERNKKLIPSDYGVRNVGGLERNLKWGKDRPTHQERNTIKNGNKQLQNWYDN